jgi:Ni/Fe-hydrogenase subunit HybB-like protein
MEKFMKMAGLGAAGVAAGTFVLYAALIFVFRPVSNGGFDHVLWLTVSVAMLIPVAVLAGAHLAFAKQLKDGVSRMPK